MRARTAERCERCGAERAWGAATACRCLAPRWRAFCTRCARGFGETLPVSGPEGGGATGGLEIAGSATDAPREDAAGTPPLCPSCVEIATVNGAKLRVALDGRLVGLAALPDLAAAWGRIETRAREALAMFGLDAAVVPLPEWAARLSDKTRPLPPGADSSRTKRDAVGALRLEDAGVRLALERLGYLGRPVEEKLRRTLDSGAAATALLAGWDGLAASAEHEHELREAADALMVAVQTTRTLVDSLRTRDLGPVVEASVRRQRAVEGCQRALGVG